MTERPSGRVIVGVVLILLGLLFLGQQLHLYSVWSFSRLWPVLLILFGLGHMLQPGKTDRKGGGGFFFVVVGSVLLLHTTGVLSVGASWPLFIVAWGLAIVMGARRRPLRPGRGNDDVK